MSRNIECYEVGSTVKFTWQSSGSAPSPISSSVINKAEAIVSSHTATDSTNGLFFANHAMPDTPGFYVNKWIAGISVNTYISARRFQVIRTEV